MDDERLKQLRALGVKSISFMNAEDGLAISHVEFFPEPALSSDATDDEPDTSEGEPVVAVPPALARIIRKGSVS